MPIFGEFETVGEPVAKTSKPGHISIIWQARRVNDRDERAYAIKCYSPRPRPAAASGPGETLGLDRGLEFLEGVKHLEAARQEGVPGLARIYGLGKTGVSDELGFTSEGAWYATDFCNGKTLKEWTAVRGRVDAAALRRVVVTILSACLGLQRVRGYSHGNLKPSNVLLYGPTRPLRNRLLRLADPYPAAPSQLDQPDPRDRQEVAELFRTTVEVQDLRALGELLLQLVEGKLLGSGFEYDWPVQSSSAWQKLGRQSKYWLDLCNKLLDPQLSLESVSFEILSRQPQLRPSAVTAKLPMILGVTVGVCVLVGMAAIVAPRVIKGIHQRTMQKDLSDVKVLLNQGKFTGAFKKLEEASSLAPKLKDLASQEKVGRAQKEAQSKKENFENASSRAELAEATNAWPMALALWKEASALCPDEPGASNGVVFATGMTNALWRLGEANAEKDDSGKTNVCYHSLSDLEGLLEFAKTDVRRTARAARKKDFEDLLSKAIERINANKLKTGCDQARNQALNAERMKDWGGALAAWQNAQAKCSGSAEITNGIAFAKAMTNALANLLTPAEMVSASAEQAKEATNWCAQALSSLDRVRTLAAGGVRQSEWQARQQDIQRLQTAATQRIEYLAVQVDCDAARNQALNAEGRKDWVGALAAWQNAQAKCSGSAEITNGVAFAKAMTNALARLLTPTEVASATLEQAKQATNWCAQALSSLDRVRTLAASGVRQSEWQARQQDIQRLQTAATQRIKYLAGQVDCDEARKQALNAEGMKDWGGALAAWQNAQAKCSGNVQITNGIVFAKAMTNVLARLLQPTEMASATAEQAKQATNWCAQALPSLDRVRTLATGGVRQSEWQARQQDIQRLQTAATQRIKYLAGQVDCDEARKQALNAEGRKDWVGALAAWQNAQAKCSGNAEITNGIAFATAMVTANDLLSKAQAKTNSAPEEAKKLSADALNALPEPALYVGNAKRTGAVNQLKNNVESLRNEPKGATKPPEATPQNVEVTAGEAKMITLSGSELGGAPLSYQVVQKPTKGTLSGTEPTLAYKAERTASGSDSFTFKVNNGMKDSAPATVGITIKPFAQPPVNSTATTIQKLDKQFKDLEREVRGTKTAPPLQTLDEWKARVKSLRNQYTNAGPLTEDRKNNLKKLEDNINNR